MKLGPLLEEILATPLDRGITQQKERPGHWDELSKYSRRTSVCHHATETSQCHGMDSGIPNMEEPSKSTCQKRSRSPRALNQRNTEAHGKGVRQALRKPEIDLPAGRSAVPQGQGDSILVRSPSPWVLGEGVLAPSSLDLNPMDYRVFLKILTHLFFIFEVLNVC